MSKPSARHGPVHKTPGFRLGSRDFFVEEKDLPRSPITYDEGKELRGAGQSHAAMAGAYLADIDVIGGHGQVATQVEFIAAAHHNAVQASDGGLANVAQPLVHLNEITHPFPIIARAFKELFLLFEVRSCAKGSLASPSKHQNSNLVIPTGILEGDA